MTPRDASKINALLASLWERGLPQLRERLEILDRTATAAASGSLTEASRMEALEIAHKFAGSLGMFGYAEGTEIARQLEQLLNQPALASSREMIELIVRLRQALPLE
jgi:HPt (histidine-containing phosphotransfer) domain-containing protein